MAARQALWLAPVLAALLACGYSSEGERTSRPDSTAEVVDAEILTGARLEGIAPGEALGVFIEYRGEGEWAIDVICDTKVSQYVCEWDIYVSSLDGESLEHESVDVEDDWVIASGDEVDLHTYTDFDFDGILIRNAPGAPLEFQVVLDALSPARDPLPERYVEWVGAEGFVHLGAPSNPIVLWPTEP